MRAGRTNMGTSSEKKLNILLMSTKVRAGDGGVIRLGVIDKDYGVGHIGLHQALGQKQRQ